MYLLRLKFALPILALFFIFSCKPFTRIPVPEPSLKEPLVVKKSLGGKYTLEFAEEGIHEVYVGTSSKSIDWNTPHFVTKKSTVTISDLPVKERYFFGVKQDKYNRFVAAERRIPVTSIVNFRDLGGIPTTDGKVTKWGKLYRSGKLADLSKKDMNYFSSLGIKTVVDFRNDKEIKKHPNKYPEHSDINYVRVVIGDKEGNVQEAMKKQIMKNRGNADFDSQAFVANVNRTFIDSFAYQYIPLMELLLDEKNYPLLFHCTAGKDRTGLAAALILGAVGVDKDYIMDDFMMSNYYRNGHNNKVLKKMTLIGVDQKVAQPLLEVDECYLGAAFEEMDKNCGDMDGFLEQQLGISDKEKAILQANLLTSFNLEEDSAIVHKSGKAADPETKGGEK